MTAKPYFFRGTLDGADFAPEEEGVQPFIRVGAPDLGSQWAAGEVVVLDAATYAKLDGAQKRIDAMRRMVDGCPNDTNGDGNCGRPLCPFCGEANEETDEEARHRAERAEGIRVPWEDTVDRPAPIGRAWSYNYRRVADGSEHPLDEIQNAQHGRLERWRPYGEAVLVGAAGFPHVPGWTAEPMTTTTEEN